MSAKKRAQVIAQCDAVAHMATVIADLHRDRREILETGRADSLIDITGRRTADLMEVLGNFLNGMDAVTEDDAWLSPIFAEAQRLWPQDAARQAEG